MNQKLFYDSHLNFTKRSRVDYFISPGIKSKFDIIIKHFSNSKRIQRAVDLGCSGDSILSFIKNITNKMFLDIVNEPLFQFTYDNNRNCYDITQSERNFPLCGDIQKLPYRNNEFNVVFALDVLEHVKNDVLCISEISRIMQKNGYAIISVPHRKRFYTLQDKMIGHYRRYEIDEIKELFAKNSLKCLDYFGIYGLLMRISLFQAIMPERVEDGIQNLRNKYNKNPIFRSFWNVMVHVISKLMKFDANYTPSKYIMNMAFIFIKVK